MLKALRPLAAFIEGFIDRIGTLTAWIALAMIGLVATNVILRYTMSVGSVWAQELEWHLLAALILLGMSHALQRGENVRVDLFYARFPAPLKRAVDVLAALLLITVSVLFIALSLGYVEQSRAIAEGSPDPGGIPLRWIVKSLIPLGYGLLVLQQLAHLVRLLSPADGAQEARRV
ncbi:TRAP transporter small permease subunit [Hydrogenophaga intermedia]|jgi:TRAP-type mannitol/chloroaromatic compound transport system permease small subunit|uniref:TRAP transporter small permease subunit n=1 Tax=Hydrogenophaga intermedia TaxID=65786 RepID=UPI0020436CD9|nr:TRAP transporter small permease subunit [Hydrogenophaga intermedia]MCM3564942.1 TRAP transporter small permease subunit [Hydrogenophaga intermedia]